MLPNGLIPSVARTVKVGGSCSCNQLSPFVSVSSSNPTSWPSKSSSDVLDYSLDFSSWLGQDELTSQPSVVITRSSGAANTATGDLTSIWSELYNPSICTLMLSYGVLGASYNIQVTVTTVQGRTIEVIMPISITMDLPQAVASGN